MEEGPSRWVGFLLNRIDRDEQSVTDGGNPLEDRVKKKRPCLEKGHCPCRGWRRKVWTAEPQSRGWEGGEEYHRASWFFFHFFFFKLEENCFTMLG